ncbi:MAG: substrate-binding domain-containing protein [Myxococcota bacterium]|nr:substrate-binding domain-containing protein [Myxococcota bacterium]
MNLATLAPLLALLLACNALAAEEPAPARSVLLATTTSVRDSGLLDRLLPIFSAQTGIAVQAVAVGTGAALRMGREGNADILLTHAPAAEKEMLADGSLSSRIEIMENYFVIAGPAEDPAGVAQAPTAQDALARIYRLGLPFVSRGDDSGTHKRERALLADAGIDPDAKWPGLTRTGSGMGISLQVAGQRQAYILSDVGTYLAFRQRIDLTVLSRPEPGLRNIYSVLLVNPEKFPRVRGEEASRLADFLQGEEAQSIMLAFGTKKVGRPLFTPLNPTTGGPP